METQTPAPETPTTDDKKPKLVKRADFIMQPGEEPRKPSIASHITRIGGYFTSMIGGGFVTEVVSDIAKEDVSAHELKEGDSILKAMQKGLYRAVDFKLWKSNLAGAVAAIGGVFLTNFAVKKIEEHTFKEAHILTDEQVRQLKLDQAAHEADANRTHNRVVEFKDGTWQDKTRPAEQPKENIRG